MTVGLPDLALNLSQVVAPHEIRRHPTERRRARILPDQLVTVVSVQLFGSEALELTYKTQTGKVANELLHRHDEPRLDLMKHGRPWSFDGDGALFRLVSIASPRIAIQ